MIMLQLRNLRLWPLLMLVVSCSTTLKQNDQLDVVQQPATTVWSKAAQQSFSQGMLQLSNDPDKAILAFQQSIKLEPKMEAAYYNLMHLYYDKKDYQQMQLLFDRCQKESVLSARILTLVAGGQRKQGQFKVAEKHYLLALENDKKYLAALANMAILQDLYLHNLPEALQYYQHYQEQLIAQGKEDLRLDNWLADIKQRISKLNKETEQ